MMKKNKSPSIRKNSIVLRRRKTLLKTVKNIYNVEEYITVTDSNTILDAEFDEYNYDDVKNIYRKYEE